MLQVHNSHLLLLGVLLDALCLDVVVFVVRRSGRIETGVRAVSVQEGLGFTASVASLCCQFRLRGNFLILLIKLLEVIVADLV